MGWGNNVHVLAHSHDVTPRHVHLHARALRHATLKMCHVTQGWGGAITFTYLRTPMMLRHGTFTCTCAHTSCYVEDVSRHAGVGWGNNVHVLAHSHDVTPRHVHLHVRALRHATLKMCHVTQGWGGAITFTYLRAPMMLRHGTFTCTCAHTSCYVEDVSRHAGVGWGGAITFTYLLRWRKVLPWIDIG